MRKSIFTAASPNTQIDDVLVAKLQIITPFNWYNKKPVRKFENELQNYTGVKFVQTIDSGRSAILVALKSLGISEGDEVIIPSFTCVVVADAVKWSGATPVYLDTNKDDLNANYSTLESKITTKTKVIIVQHTFGKIVDVDAIRESLKIMNRSDIKILEDFAHTIFRNLTFKGDVGILTFGIEKVISSVRGGAIITNDEVIANSVNQNIAKLPEFPRKQIMISLMNPVFWWVAIPLHSVGFGRFTIGAFIRGIWRKLGFLGIMVEESENRAIKPDWFPAKLPGALAALGRKQLKKLDKYNEHRSKIAGIYHKYLNQVSDISSQEPRAQSLEQERVYLRYPLILKDKKQWLQVWNLSRKLRVTPGNWFAVPLYGASVNDTTYKTLSYNPKDTPNTLHHCERVLNLPTSVNMSESRAEELAKTIKEIIDIN